MTLYARCYDVGAPAACQYGPSSSVSFTVNVTPTTPTSVNAATTSGCSGYSSNLSATCATGSVRWYNSATGTGAGLSSPLTISSNQTVFARCFNTANPVTCQYGIASTGIALNIFTTPTIPTAVNITTTNACPGYTTTLSGICATGSIRWYNTPTGTGVGLTSPLTVDSNQTVYARCFNTSAPIACQYGIASTGVPLTAIDLIPPTVICKDTSVYLDASGNITITPSIINNASTDNCSLDSLWVDTANFTCMDTGTHIIKLYVRDVSFNIDSCTANVTILDTIRPVLTICPVDTSIDIDQPCNYIIPDFTIGLSATDNCSGTPSITYTQYPVAGTVINTNTTVTQLVTVRATDDSGNTDSCEFNIDITCTAEIKIPQFISPNNDGINDTWFIESIEQYSNSNVKIFNRWGVLIFEMNNYDNSWNGFVNRGTKINSNSTEEIMPSGTYFYIVDLGNETEHYTGYVFIRK
jgi:gliding motility-associated-like protein